MLTIICVVDLIITTSKVQKKDAILAFICACLYPLNTFLAWYIHGKLNCFRLTSHYEISFKGRNPIYPKWDYEKDTIMAILESLKMSFIYMLFFVLVYAISSIKHIIYNKIATLHQPEWTLNKCSIAPAVGQILEPVSLKPKEKNI